MMHKLWNGSTNLQDSVGIVAEPRFKMYTLHWIPIE